MPSPAQPRPGSRIKLATAQSGFMLRQLTRHQLIYDGAHVDTHNIMQGSRYLYTQEFRNLACGTHSLPHSNARLLDLSHLYDKWLNYPQLRQNRVMLRQSGLKSETVLAPGLGWNNLAWNPTPGLGRHQLGRGLQTALLIGTLKTRGNHQSAPHYQGAGCHAPLAIIITINIWIINIYSFCLAD